MYWEYEILKRIVEDCDVTVSLCKVRVIHCDRRVNHFEGTVHQ